MIRYIAVCLTLLITTTVYAQEADTPNSQNILSEEAYNKAPFKTDDREFEDRARLWKEIRLNEQRVEDLHITGLVTSVGAGVGYITYSFAQTESVEVAGLTIGIGSYLVHEYILNFVLLKERLNIMKQKYILASNWDGIPPLKRNKLIANMGYLSGSQQMLRTEYIYDGYFWATAFGAHSIVFTHDLIDDADQFSNAELLGNSAFLGLSALYAFYKFWFAYRWKKEYHKEMERLHLSFYERGVDPLSNSFAGQTLGDVTATKEKRIESSYSYRY